MPSLHFTRREFLAAAAGAAAASAAGCSPSPLTGSIGSPQLTSRPGTPAGSATPGLTSLQVALPGRALLYVPPGYRAAQPAPFVLMFHGASGSADGPITLLQTQADARGLVLLACDSQGPTWDAIRSTYGTDIRFLNAALRAAFEVCAVDASRMTIEGFSDGATYAIGVGRANGDLFSKVAAFSPGFLLPTTTAGKPAFYISHGTQDTVLPIEHTSRPIVATLRTAYAVQYDEFDGGHFVPENIVARAAEWMAASRVV